MSDAVFDAGGVGVANGNFFGFPRPDAGAPRVALIPVGWDVTTSFRPGTSGGPAAMLEASTQLDFFDFEIDNAWQTPVDTLEADPEIAELNVVMRPKADAVIRHLESGGSPGEVAAATAEVNNASRLIVEKVRAASLAILDKGWIPAVIGGDHSTPLGLMQALAERHGSFGILHIDAHADLRNAYEGFEFSHASIMFNALKINQVSKLTQVAVRDVCEAEISLAALDSRVDIFSEAFIAEHLFAGRSWDALCRTIVDSLPSDVYVSFDIDGLDPSLCPETGTPVPGGLSFSQSMHLLNMLCRAGKRVVGFDLCEVGTGDFDANVGARVLYKLCAVAGRGLR